MKGGYSLESELRALRHARLAHSPVWTRILALNLSSAAAAAATPANTSTRTPRVWRHPSGLTVIHRKISTAPVVAVQLWVGVGSADESLSQLGMAHVHEHLVFKGTERRGVGEIAEQVEAAGGSINAWTSLEETVYHVVMPAVAARLGMDILLDGTLHTAFEPEELSRELEVIREEIRRGDDVPARSHMEHLFGSLWADHPYGRRVIGDIESVSAFDAPALREFHGKWYVPQNMRLVVVGDCEREDVEQWVDELLVGIPSVDAPHPERHPTATRRTKTTQPIIEYREVENARITLGFDGPSLTHPEAPAVDLLCALIAGTNSSLLYDRLVRKEALALGAWSDTMNLRESGIVMAGATFSPEHSAADVVRVLGEELGGAAGRFREDDLQRAKRSYEAAYLKSGATVQSIANSYGSGHLHVGDADAQARWMEHIAGLSLEDVRAAARRWLDPRALTIVAQLPLSEKSKELRPSALLDAFEDGFQRRVRVARSSAPKDHQGYQQFELENGIRLLVQREPTLPLFNLRMGVRAGSLSDPVERSGRSALMTSLLVSGNRRLDTQALEQRLDQVGASASASAGQTTTVFSLSGLAQEQSATIELAEWSWLESDFPEEEVERVKRVRHRALIQAEENPNYLAMRALRQNFFKNHPYGFPSEGTLDSITAMNREDLRDAHRLLLDPAALVVSAVGDLDVDALIDQLSAWRGEPAEATKPPASPAAPTWPDRQEIVVEHARKQAVVYVAYPGLGRDHEDAAALNVMTVLMSGQGGRLFKVLREERSLAYSVTMGADAFADGGMIYGRIETSPSKIDEAIRGMREELSRLRDEALDSAEIARAKARLAGQMQVSMQTGGARASLTLRDELLGRGYRYGLDFPDRFAAVTAQQIQRLAERLLRAEHEVVVVARPAAGE